MDKALPWIVALAALGAVAFVVMRRQGVTPLIPGVASPAPGLPPVAPVAAGTNEYDMGIAIANAAPSLLKALGDAFGASSAAKV